jgi:replicative DNA helicase
MENLRNVNPVNVDKSKIISLEKGKLPPQAIDLEEAVLGAMMIDKKGLDEVVDLLNADCFYKDAHVHIFSAIVNLYKSHQPIDMLTVSNELKRVKKLDLVGGDFYLIQLTQKVSSSAHIEFHSRIILQKYISRQLIRISSETIEMAYEDSIDVFDLTDTVSGRIDVLMNSVTKGYSSMSWEDAVMSVPKRVEFLTNNKGIVTGVPTGLDAIDKHFNGWQPTDFIVIGADNGMGKTAFVLCNMIAAAKEGNAVGMFSMEMSVVQLAVRGVANESEFHMNQLMRNGFEHNYYFNKLNEVTNEMAKLPIYIDDQPALTVVEMKRKGRQLKRKHDIKLLVIDFMQMFSGDKDIRINISEAARECKNLAKELNIPVIGLSQLSREVKKEKYKIPSKHHLKESSAIEEAADVIGLLYRPDYYGYTRDNNPDLYENELGLIGSENACLIVAKNRNGGMGNIGLRFIENKTKYVNPAYELQSIELQEKPLPLPSPGEAFDVEDPNHFV